MGTSNASVADSSTTTQVGNLTFVETKDGYQITKPNGETEYYSKITGASCTFEQLPDGETLIVIHMKGGTAGDPDVAILPDGTKVEFEHGTNVGGSGSDPGAGIRTAEDPNRVPIRVIAPDGTTTEFKRGTSVDNSVTTIMTTTDGNGKFLEQTVTDTARDGTLSSISTETQNPDGTTTRSGAEFGPKGTPESSEVTEIDKNGDLVRRTYTQYEEDGSRTITTTEKGADGQWTSSEVNIQSGSSPVTDSSGNTGTGTDSAGTTVPPATDSGNEADSTEDSGGDGGGEGD